MSDLKPLVLRPPTEWVLCAAVYVDTGQAEPPRMSHAYPATGLLFCGHRHPDCFVLLAEWRSRLSMFEVFQIEAIDAHQLRGSRQGFLTSKGRFVDRREGGQIAYAAGQVDRLLTSLTSEDLY